MQQSLGSRVLNQYKCMQVYIIGGDGTLQGAVKIFNEIQSRKLYVGVAAIPNTVDNGSKHRQSVQLTLKQSALNGTGFVKLMGRSTCHIALSATLSSHDVDCCLIPENEC